MTSDQALPRVLLVGLGPTTESALAGLCARFDVVGLVRDTQDHVTDAARTLGVPVTPAAGLQDLTTLVDGLRPDCVVVSSYHRILPADLLERCPFVNVHYAPLPRYRGRANVNWAVINGDPEAAVTVHSMVPGLDAGGILAQQSVPIGERETIGQLYARLNEVQRTLLPEAVARRLGGDLGEPQDELQATYGCTRTPDDGCIDWTRSTRDIDRLVRGLSDPYPGAFTFLRLRRLWVVEAEPAPQPRSYVGRVPGRVVGSSATEGWADVLTGDGVLRLRKVRHDADVVPAATVLRGTRQTLGVHTTELVDRIHALERALESALDPAAGDHRDRAACGARARR